MQCAIIVVLLFLVGASMAVHSAFGGGEGRHGRFGHDPLFMLLHKLDLSDSQKQQAAVILSGNEQQAKGIASNLATARGQLLTAILSNGDVTTASANVAKYSLEAAQLAATIVSGIAGILTPEQQSIFQGMQAKVGSHAGRAVEARFAHWDKFIAKYGQGQ